MNLGYARISTDRGQDTAAQLDALREAGCERMFEERASGGRWDRPELPRMLDQLRDGDVLTVRGGEHVRGVEFVAREEVLGRKWGDVHRVDLVGWRKTSRASWHLQCPSTKKRLARVFDRIVVKLLFFAEPSVAQQFGHTHDTIHRCADFVAHVCKESGLGPAGSLCFGLRGLELFFVLDCFGDVQPERDDVPPLPAPVHQLHILIVPQADRDRLWLRLHRNRSSAFMTATSSLICSARGIGYFRRAAFCCAMRSVMKTPRATWARRPGRRSGMWFCRSSPLH